MIARKGFTPFGFLKQFSVWHNKKKLIFKIQINNHKSHLRLEILLGREQWEKTQLNNSYINSDLTSLDIYKTKNFGQCEVRLRFKIMIRINQIKK